MPSDELVWHDSFEAAFDITSLLTSLFVGSWPDPPHQLDPRLWAALMSVHTRNWADPVPVNPLPPLSEQHRRTLFHERVHYWQLMSLPLQQSKFLLDLERIKAGALRAGARHPHISGVAFRDEPLSELVLYQSYHSVQANMATPRIADIRGNAWDTNVDHSPEGIWAMSYVMFPWGSPQDNEQLPAYVGVIGFEDNDEPVFVPFSGRNLLESAAYLCERLKGGELPERIGPSSNQKDVTYLGAWRFWVRVHGQRYPEEKDLVLGFLAAVDLAMCSDFDPDDYGRIDEEERTIWTSIPYRFGKIVYRLRGMPPLRASGSPADVIARFQADFCRWCGIPEPAVIVRKAIARLTKAMTVHMSQQMLLDHQDEIIPVIRQTEWELEPHIEDVERLWPLIQADLRDAPAIGQVIMWVMLSMLRFRLRHPGMFAAPHLYEDALSELFPLPLLCHDGLYYFDETPSSSGRDQDLASDPTTLLHDCLSLMTMSPLRTDDTQCGFIAKVPEVQCWYRRSGLGCPALGLDQNQARIRRDTELGDWCHYKQRRLRLNLP